jgi:flagellar protein FlaG
MMINRIGTSVQENMSNSVRGQTTNEKTTEPTQTKENQENVSTFPKEKMDKVVQAMNKFVSASTTHIKFELHDKLNEYFVKVIDDSTQEVVKEIPSKKLMDIYAAMNEYLGILVDQKI